MSKAPLAPRSRLKAPKAAAIAGIVFSVLLITSLTIILSIIPARLQTHESWILVNQSLLLVALNLIPFAGIAFLWFIGVVRDLLGEREDQFFSTVFLGSGLLFLAMLFISSSVTRSLIFLENSLGNNSLINSAAPPGLMTTLYDLMSLVSQEILNTYGIRMAGVFMISTCTVFLRTNTIPRWTAWLGYGFAILMLLRLSYIDRLGWVALLFPLWVLLISIYILMTNYRHQN